MSFVDRLLYKDKISSYEAYNRSTNYMNVPGKYDCADVATYLYGEGMKNTFTGRSTSDLKHNGYSLSNLSDICSMDYFPADTDNVSFYADKSFNNPNVEVGSVLF